MTRDKAPLLIATIVTAGTLFLPPDWKNPLADICHVAAIVSAVVILMLWVTRWFGDIGLQVERASVALFLLGMPLVYIIAWMQDGRSSHPWLWVELAGLAGYG